MNIKETLKNMKSVGCIANCTTPNTKYYELYKKIYEETSFLSIDATFKDRIYCILNDIKDNKKCLCNCGEIVKHPHLNYIRGHSNRDITVKEKKILAYSKKYGVDNPSQSVDIKHKKQQTFIKNFGQTHYMKSDIGRTKHDSAVFEKYGVTNVFMLNDVKNKIKETLKPFRKAINEKIIKTSRNKFYNNLIFGDRLSGFFDILFTRDEFVGVGVKKYKFRCKTCGEVTESTLDDGQLPRCYNCNPLINTKGQSNIENEIYEHLKQFCDIKTHDRSVIKPLELDLYIKDSKLAVELDGLYWHSEVAGNKNYNYHINKTKECNNIGIRLIHIFEDEWNFKKNIVKNRFKHILNRTKYKIYARKCHIKEISDNLKNKFLNKYHIQGEDRCEKNIGLFYRNRLVAVMTFSKLRKALGSRHESGKYELSRYCTINNFNIIGGAGKLLSYFEKTYNPVYIKTYSDIRWNTGNLYKELGFTFLYNTRPNYWYLDKTYQNRLHRYNYKKDNLKKKLKNYNESLTESVNMKLNGYDRIWDCGNMVFEKVY